MFLRSVPMGVKEHFTPKLLTVITLKLRKLLNYYLQTTFYLNKIQCERRRG